MRGSLVAALALAAATTAHAHDSWISNQRLTDPLSKEWCCNLHDCQEETANIAALPDGNYLVRSTREVIVLRRVIWRSPGGWWRCRHTDGSNRTRCLIGPPSGS